MDNTVKAVITRAVPTNTNSTIAEPRWLEENLNLEGRNF